MSRLFLGFFLRLALKRRRVVLIMTVLLTLGTGFLTSQIGLDMKWTSLLPESDPIVHEWLRAMEDYPSGSNYIITVKSDSPVIIEQAIDEITKQVESLKGEVTTTYGKVSEAFLIKHGFRSVKPKDLNRAVDIFSDTRLVPYLTHLNDDFEKEYSGDVDKVKDQERDLVRNLSALEDFIVLLDGVVNGRKTDKAHLTRVVRDLSSGNPYFLSLDKKMGIIPVAVKASATDFEKAIYVDGKIRKVLREIESAMPGVEIGTTGIIPTGRDEMESVGPYTIVLSLLALVLVFAILVWNYRSVVIPVLGILPIVIGIIWAMGFYRVTIHDLNIFTAMIMLVLIGLGIDFSIHLITRFYEERSAGASLEIALERSVVLTGKGILTGALTTAMAFFALMVGDTKGIIEFGFCAGAGIIITLVAIFFILPSLLVWRDNRLSRKGRIVETRDFVVLGKVAGNMTTGRRKSVIIILVLAVVAVLQLGNLAYEYNLLETEPKGLESIQLQQEIIDRFKLSAEMAFTTVDSIESSRKLTRKLKKKAVIGEIDSIDRWIPAPEWIEQNDMAIHKLRGLLELNPGQNLVSPNSESSSKAMVDQIQRLLFNMIEVEELSFIGGQDRVVAALERITGGEAQNGRLVKLVNQLNEGQINWYQVQAFASDFSQLLKTRVGLMVEHDGPVTEEMLPAKLRALYKNQENGRYLVQIYPKKNLYEREPLLRFINAAESVTPRIAGMPKLMQLINDAMVKDGIKALLAAGLVILILLIFDLRNVTAACIALIPLVFGSLWMVSMMAILGIKLNFVNIIAIPIIIGIGIDNGIHILHRWRYEGVGGIKKAATKVGHPILLTSLTTMIGFGSIAFYTHRGMASLGYVLFAGVGFCFISTILILPLLGSFVEKRIMAKVPLRSD